MGLSRNRTSCPKATGHETDVAEGEAKWLWNKSLLMPWPGGYSHAVPTVAMWATRQEHEPLGER